MRHAKSDWANRNNTDHQRPLNARGIRDAPVIGARIKEKGILPDLVLVSDAQRTRDTWKLIQPYLVTSKVQFLAELYLANSIELLKIIQQSEDKHQTIMILAHNPGITYAFYELAQITIDNVPTAGVGCIEFDCMSFSEIAESKSSLTYFTYPKDS